MFKSWIGQILERYTKQIIQQHLSNEANITRNQLQRRLQNDFTIPIYNLCGKTKIANGVTNQNQFKKWNRNRYLQTLQRIQYSQQTCKSLWMQKQTRKRKHKHKHKKNE